MSLGMADLNADVKVDVVYGGDLKGNVYRWDFSGAALPTGAVKLFQATDASGTPQPITGGIGVGRSEEHTSELQSLMRISYAVFCLIKKKRTIEFSKIR